MSILAHMRNCLTGARKVKLDDMISLWHIFFSVKTAYFW